MPEKQPPLSWQIDAQSLASDLEADALERSIRAECPITDDQKANLSEFVVMLTCTRELTINTRAKPAVHIFQGVIEHWRDLGSDAVWAARLNMPYKLLENWRRNWVDAQELFEVDPAQLPTSALSPAQLEELKQPDSPLP